MASKCPKCGEKLKWYDIKAECKHCGINIPNYNWEARLEEDNKTAEERFQRLYYILNDLKFTSAGTKLRKWRILLTLIPAIGFILPWAQIESQLDTLSLDLLGIFTDGYSTINFFGTFFSNLGTLVPGAFSGEPYGEFIIGFLLMLLSVLSIVIAFLLTFVLFRKPKTKAMCVFDVLSIIFACLAVYMFTQVNSSVCDIEPFFNIGKVCLRNATANVMWGVFVYIALLFIPLAVNIKVTKEPVKDRDTLEAERLEKVRKKEEKEEAERQKKEAAKIEARKKAEEEEAEKIRKAREALDSKKNK